MSTYSTLFFGSEITLSILFAINAMYDFALHAWLRFWMKPIIITKDQRRLLKISDDECGFTDFSPEKSKKESTDLHKSTAKFTITSEIDKSSTPLSNSQLWSNNFKNSSFYTSTPSNLSLINNSSINRSFNSPSWVFQKNVNQSSSSFDESYARKRSSFNSSSNDIKDELSLRKYLKRYEEMEEKIGQMNEVEQQQQNQSQISFSIQKPKINLENVSYQLANDSLISSNIDPNDKFSTVLVNTKSVDHVNITILIYAKFSFLIELFLCFFCILDLF